MNSILDFLNQPIVLTLVTLAVGSYLLNLVTERRARNDKLRDKTIDFLSEAGNHINQFLPHVYRQLHTNSIEPDQAIADGLKELFAKRIYIEVGSQAYLNSEGFPKRYYRLLDELVAVVGYMTELDQGATAEEVVLRIQEHRKRLGESWPLTEEFPVPSGGRPVDELILWMDMVSHRTTYLLSSHLKSVLR